MGDKIVKSKNLCCQPVVFPSPSLLRRFYLPKKSYEKHISKKTHGLVYYIWMLPSKVMPYLLRLAAPLMDSSIVHWNNFQVSLKHWNCLANYGLMVDHQMCIFELLTLFSVLCALNPDTPALIQHHIMIFKTRLKQLQHTTKKS